MLATVFEDVALNCKQNPFEVDVESILSVDVPVWVFVIPANVLKRPVTCKVLEAAMFDAKRATTSDSKSPPASETSRRPPDKQVIFEHAVEPNNPFELCPPKKPGA